ncbi:MAG: hypothetical protein QXV17_13810 [Candidatus Micrarchaeaceae archaeon]
MMVEILVVDDKGILSIFNTKDYDIKGKIIFGIDKTWFDVEEIVKKKTF